MFSTMNVAVLVAACNAQQLMPELVQNSDVAMDLLANWKELTNTGKLLTNLSEPKGYPGDGCCAFYSGEAFTGKRTEACL